MKIALLHHWLNDIRGGEKVFEIFCELFPEADIYTLFYTEEKTIKCIKNHKVFVSRLNRYKIFRNNHTNLFMLFPFFTEQFDLTGYDLVISSDTISMKGVITSPDTCHICYCHTPPRYVWDRYFEYLNNAGLGKLKRMFAEYFLHRYRIWDSIAGNRVDYYFANSNFVARRIAKIYRRKACVLNPPVRCNEFSIGTAGDYYLVLGQLVPYKRVDLAVEAFKLMPDKKLIIAGSGPNEKILKKDAPANIEFISDVSDTRKVELFKGCKAFLFPGVEDYGITPLEAQACGRPVIGYKCGGILDTVRGVDSENANLFDSNKHTGMFFNDQHPESIKDAIEQFELHVEGALNPGVIRNHTEKFDAKHFSDKFQKFVMLYFEDFRKNGPPTYTH